MAIELLSEATPDLEAAFATLIPQLSSSSTPMKIEELEAMLNQDSIFLFIYRDDENDGKIMGMLTLVMFQIPTGWRSWIEDVVVADSMRGRGVGGQLVEAAVDFANSKGTKSIDLTSRPSREAANRLYRRCGFNARETNVYRYQG